ncbi:uncharacterized protein LOC135944663 [Cloeon dipterum]|uniref:uncharacterized protein LOC135944663 n=1 Tax=Cloeon dipterum TaxID=197152 RepID=UPI00321FF76F
MRCLLMLVIFALCSLAFAKKGDKAKMKVDRYAGSTRPCNPRVFATLDSACSMPKFMPVATIEECFGKNASKEAIKKAAFSANRKNKGKDNPGNENPINSIKPGRREFGPEGGPMCFVKCVFEKEKLCDAKGVVDINAVKQKFSANSNDTWKSTVEKSVDTCWADFQNVNFSNSSTVPNEAKNCKGDAAMLTACVRRALFMDCKNIIDKNKYEKKRSKVEKCDPFSIPPPRYNATEARKSKRNMGKGNKIAKDPKTQG